MSERFRTPFVPTQQYQRGSLGDLIARRGDIEAQGAMASGGAWANAISQVGNIAAGAFQEYGAQKEHKAALQAKELAERPAREMAATKSRLEMEKMQREGAAAGKAEADKAALNKGLTGTRAQAIEMFKDQPELAEKAILHFDSQDKRMAGYLGQSAAAIRSAGDDPRIALMELSNLEENGFLNPAKLKPYRDAIMADPKSVTAIVDELLSKSGEKEHVSLITKKLTPQEIAMAEDRKADNARAETTLAETIRHNKAVEAKASAGSQNKIWVQRPGADGTIQPVFVSESEVRPGDRPSNSREQGRPVLSGDANRLADSDSSLSEAEKLTDTMKTGNAAWLGTKIPDFVTEYTGWGSNAKVQEGVINKVKQIIGKAMEGGVLRKEDEIKYAKIIPKIEDAPDVANGKIQGLIKTLLEKRGFLIDSLDDAGYDVSKFRERGKQSAPALDGTKPGPGASKPQSGPPKMGEQRTIKGQRAYWDGKGWLPI